MWYLAAILLFVAVLVWDVVTDYQKWLKQRVVQHSKDAWLRILLLLPSIVCFIIAHPVNEWWVMAVVLSMTGFVFWFLFDGFYNILRGENWWFTGSNDADDAHTDDFLQSIPHWAHIGIKLTGMAGSLLLYIL